MNRIMFCTTLLFLCTHCFDSGSSEPYFIQSGNSENSTPEKEAKFSLMSDGVQDIGLCEQCDSIYLNFPNTKFKFDSLYNYTDSIIGVRYFHAKKDIDLYFLCIDSCDDFHSFTGIINLLPVIDYQADAPMIIQNNIVKLVLNKNLQFIKFLNEIEYFRFKITIDYLFKNLSRIDTTYSKICKVLSSIEYEDKNKSNLISFYCD